MMPTGLDVAATALANGAAETLADAPADYRQQQRAAQEGQLGIWAGQTPAPLILQHPTVQTTATLSADGRSVTLDGVYGFAAPFYTLQLQTYIGSHGDRVSCQQRGNTGRYVCLLPDKADLAAVALTSGLARASAEASAEYRADQARAEADRSGIWFEPPIQGGVAQPVLNAVPNCCVYAQGDVAEGITYADGVPTALVGGEPVFFVYDGLLGFGFFDVERRFHRAPEPFLSHLNRFHPQGAGLRGLGSAVSAPAAGAFRAPVLFSPGGTRAALADGYGGQFGRPWLPVSVRRPRCPECDTRLPAGCPVRGPGGGRAALYALSAIVRAGDRTAAGVCRRGRVPSGCGCPVPRRSGVHRPPVRPMPERGRRSGGSPAPGVRYTRSLTAMATLQPNLMTRLISA